MATTNKEYEVKITIADKSVIIPKGFISSIRINKQISQYCDTEYMVPVKYLTNNQSVAIEFKKQDTYLFSKILNLKTEHTSLEFFGSGTCFIDTRKKDELEIKIIHD